MELGVVIMLVFANCELLEGRAWIEIMFLFPGPGTQEALSLAKGEIHAECRAAGGFGRCRPGSLLPPQVEEGEDV